jgi:hypothetical protein
MITPPKKAGWYWILRLEYGSVPEVCFWTGASFLSIHSTESALLPARIARCGDEPLIPPASMMAS